MQPNIQEIYRRNVFPLSDEDQLKLASLILESVTEKHAARKGGTSIRELFGSADLGFATGTGNEEIDDDLAKAYLNREEDDR
jgi:hypothetical protein